MNDKDRADKLWYHLRILVTAIKQGKLITDERGNVYCQELGEKYINTLDEILENTKSKKP